MFVDVLSRKRGEGGDGESKAGNHKLIQNPKSNENKSRKLFLEKPWILKQIFLSKSPVCEMKATGVVLNRRSEPVSSIQCSVLHHCFPPPFPFRPSFLCPFLCALEGTAGRSLGFSWHELSRIVSTLIRDKVLGFFTHHTLSPFSAFQC